MNEEAVPRVPCFLLLLVLLLSLLVSSISPLTRSSSQQNYSPNTTTSIDDGFELYPVGVNGPGNWRFYSTGSCSWFGATFGSGQGRTPAVNPFAGAVDYNIGMTADCSGTSYAEIYEPFVATANIVSLNFMAYTTNSSGFQPFGYISQSVPTPWPGQTITFPNRAWTIDNYSSGSLTPTFIYYIVLGVFIPTPTTSPAIVYFDNVVVKGAALYNHPTDFQAVDFNTGQLADLAGGYTGPSPLSQDFSLNSKIYINYTSGSGPFTYVNVTAPDLSLPLAGAKLLTVWVGSYYERTLIPSPSGNTTMYLNSPATVVPYDFEVQDLTGSFPAGSVIEILSGSLVITSGYTDVQNSFSTFLQPGSYSILIQNNGASYSGTLSLGTNNGIIQITISKISVKGTSGPLSATSWGTAWQGNNLITVYNDSTGTTTVITYQLILENSSGIFLIYTNTYTGSWGTFENSVASNASLADELYVKLLVTDQYGSFVLGPRPAAVGLLFPQPPNFPADALGLDMVIPSGSVWAELIAIIILVVMAGAFGYKASPFGFIATAFVAALFGFAGWLPITGSVIAIIITLAFTAFLINKERGQYY